MAHIAGALYVAWKRAMLTVASMGMTMMGTMHPSATSSASSPGMAMDAEKWCKGWGSIFSLLPVC